MVGRRVQEGLAFDMEGAVSTGDKEVVALPRKRWLGACPEGIFLAAARTFIKRERMMNIDASPSEPRALLQTLPGDDVRQIMWRFADRFDYQMVVQSARAGDPQLEAAARLDAGDRVMTLTSSPSHAPGAPPAPLRSSAVVQTLVRASLEPDRGPARVSYPWTGGCDLASGPLEAPGAIHAGGPG